MPLMQAVRSSDIESARLLLKYGAKPEAMDNVSNVPPLCVALHDGYLEVAQLLMDYGISINAHFTTVDKAFNPPYYLFALTYKNHGEQSAPLYELLIRSGFTLTDKVIPSVHYDATLLHMFAESGNLYGLNKWAEAGLSNVGENALHYAMHSRLDDEISLKVVRFLVEKGVSKNVVSS